MTHNTDQLPIMVIDDSPEDFQSLRRCFSRLGFTNPLVHCEEGQEALSLLESTGKAKARKARDVTPGCILLDLNMPGMDGREVLRFIKTHPRLKQVPVVVLSSSNDPRDITTCYRDGANSYMVKPPNFEGLVKSMEAFRTYWLETVEHPV